MKLIFARHGEVELNKESKFCGHIESSLTEEGIKQKERLRDYFKDYGLTKIYSSPFLRAYETELEVGKELNLDVIKNDNLKEICYGSFEGKSKKELKLLKIWGERESDKFGFMHPESYKSIKGESYENQYKKLSAFLDNIIQIEKGTECILIVSHIGICKNAMIKFGAFNKEDFSGYDFKNNEIFVVELSDKKIVKFLNHLIIVTT